MSKFFNKISLMAFLSFIMLPSMSQAATLNPGDLVGISFWVISIAMVAATVFFLWEATCASGPSGLLLYSCCISYTNSCRSLFLHERYLGCLWR